MKHSRWVAALVAVTFGISCGNDSTGPNLVFPTLPAAAVAAFCVIGTITKGQSRNSSLTSGDCDSGVQYYETWQLKVAANGSVNISMTSAQFDTYLVLGQIDSIVANDVFVTILAENDDRSGTDLNALIQNANLLAARDYLIAAAGFDYSETGGYLLSIQ